MNVKITRNELKNCRNFLSIITLGTGLNFTLLDPSFPNLQVPVDRYIVTSPSQT